MGTRQGQVRRAVGVAVIATALVVVAAGCNPTNGLTMNSPGYTFLTSTTGGWVEVQVRSIVPPTTVVGAPTSTGPAISGADPDISLEILVYLYQPTGHTVPATLPCVGDGPGGIGDVAPTCGVPVVADTGSDQIVVAHSPIRVMFTAGGSTGYKRFVRLPGPGGFMVQQNSRQPQIDVRIVDDAGQPVGDIGTHSVAPALS